MKPDAVYSVVFPIKEDEHGNIKAVSLSTKARKIFKGLIIGVGGRMDLVDASVRECGCRETREEINRRYEEHELEEVGVIVSHEPSCVSQVHFFLARGGKGPIRETKDKGVLKPTWYPPAKVPFEKMPVHYPLLLGKFLKGFRVEGTIVLDPQKNILFDLDLKTSKKVQAPA